MGLVDKIKGFMNAPDDEYYDDQEDNEPPKKRRYEEDDYFGYNSSSYGKNDAPSYSSSSRQKDFFGKESSYSKERDRESAPREQKEAVGRNKVVNIHATTQLQVVLVKPERFDDASSIADHLNSKRTVLLNLESASREVTRRLVDFLSGVAYANNGQLKKVANSTFIITPFDVDIMGDLLLDELESSGFYI